MPRQFLVACLLAGAALSHSATPFNLDWQQGADFRRASVSPKKGSAGFRLLPPHETGVNFTNQLSDSALARNQILEIGSGVALGDVDQDGVVDIYFCSMQGGNRLFRNLGNWKFEDITESSGAACAGQFSTGAALADIDNDTDLDLLVTGIGAGTRIFLNNGKGTFSEKDAGLRFRRGSTSMALADINGDGYLDLYVANYHTRTVKDSPQINVNVREVNGRMEISPPGMFLPLHGKSGSISLFERGEPDAIYLNDGKGGFLPLDWTSGLFLDAGGKPLTEAPKDWALSVMFRDMNGDGAPDIYVCNDFFYSPDHIWLNDGAGKFKMAPPQSIRHTSMSSMAVDFADINRDGLDDFFVLDMMSRDHRTRHRQRSSLVHVNTITPVHDPGFRPEYPRNTLFVRRSDGTYAEIAALAGVEASEWSWSASFLDVDLDGYEDLLITNGNRRNANDADATGKGNLRFGKLETPNLLFRNEGNLRFQEVGDQWGFNQVGIAHGMALGDLDNDGDLDAVINNMGSPAAIYMNNSSAPRIAVRLKGTHTVGSRIILRRGAVPLQSQEVLSGGRYLSCDDGTRVFAAGSASGPMSLEVNWRDGRRTVLNDVRPNSLYEITADRAQPFENEAAPLVQPLFEDISSTLRTGHQEAAVNDWAIQPLLPTAASQGGPGVAWFDADEDGRDDLMFGNGRGESQVLFLNTATGFKPMKRAGILSRDQSTLLGWRDHEASRILAGYSSYEVGPTNESALFEYNLSIPGRDHVFDRTPASTSALALGVLDGEMALFTGGSYPYGAFPRPAASRLYRRKDNQWQIDARSSASLTNIGSVNGAVWADLEGEGQNALILACDYGPIRIFKPHDGTLKEFTAESGLDQFPGRWNGVATGDFDGDGKLEIVASNWGSNTKYQRHRSHPIRLYHGDWNGDGKIDILEACYEPSLNGYAPFATLDILREHLPELASRFTTFAEYGSATVEQILGAATNLAIINEISSFESCVFFNRGGQWVPYPLPIEAQFAPAFGIAVGDADGDGHEDIFLSQNFFEVDAEASRHDNGQGLWLLGNGRGAFTAKTALESGVALTGSQRGCAVADFDLDGRLDLAVGQNRGSLGLFRNARGKAGLRVRLRGPKTNPNGISATVRLRFDEGWSPVKQIQAGSGYWSQSSPVLVFGLPKPARQIEVRWPGGKTTKKEIPADAKEITITQE